MSLPDTVRNIIAGPVLAIAGPFRADIVITPIIEGSDMYGPTYGDPFDAQALVENVSEAVTSANGTSRVSAAKFTFLDRLVVNEGDLITLNGVTTAVVKIGGLLDETGVPYVPEAWTGKTTQVGG
jgi:hypothetical protein